jgi:hypothetical protein
VRCKLSRDVVVSGPFDFEAAAMEGSKGGSTWAQSAMRKDARVRGNDVNDKVRTSEWKHVRCTFSQIGG